MPHPRLRSTKSGELCRKGGTPSSYSPSHQRSRYWQFKTRQTTLHLNHVAMTAFDRYQISSRKELTHPKISVLVSRKNRPILQRNKLFFVRRLVSSCLVPVETQSPAGNWISILIQKTPLPAAPPSAFSPILGICDQLRWPNSVQYTAGFTTPINHGLPIRSLIQIAFSRSPLA